MSLGERISEGTNFAAEMAGDVLIIRVFNPPGLSPEDGAIGGRKMVDLVDGEIFRKPRRCAAAVFDVREGPTRFGPLTRATLEGMIDRAARVGFIISVLTSEAPMQQLQFTSLCSRAFQIACLFTDEEAAMRWARRDSNF